MRRLSALVAAASVFALAGCYHAVIDTGRAPAGEPNVTPWAHGFIFGLVPPSITETVKKCPSGVAKVETKQSFVNGLAGFLTGGLYSPMTISYTCAKSGAELPSAKTIKVGEAGAQAAMQQAVELSQKLSTIVFVQF